MAKYLFIIESPGKQKKIQSFLGKEFLIVSTKGHIRDLPKKKIGVDIKNNFTPVYEIFPEKKEIVNLIKKEAKKAEIVYIATDSDAEGHGISQGIKEILPAGTEYKRVVYNSITKDEILKAIENAGDIDTKKVNCFECRRILDRIVGWRASFPTKQATGGRSAGRVQSAALRIISEREKEINNFIPKEYWPIEVELKNKNNETFKSTIKVPKSLDINNENEANDIVEKLKKNKWIVAEYEVKNKLTKPYSPFITSTLYQSGSSILGWGNKKTASVAQYLYETSFCLLPDEQIILNNGSIIPICDAHKYIGNYAIGFGKFNSFDEIFDLKSKKTNILDFQKIPYCGIIKKIRTLDGQEISSTPDHKFLCFNEENIIWKKVEEINEKEDFILCSKNIKCKRSNKKINILDFVKNLPEYVLNKILISFKKDNNEKLKEYIYKIIDKNKKKIKETTFYKYKENLKIPILWILKDKKKNINFIIQNMEYLQWANPNSKKENIDVFSFCYFLGMYLGDGHLVRNRPLISFYKGITSNNNWEKISSGIVFEQKNDIINSKKYIRFYGRVLAELCNYYGGYRGKKSDKIFLHPFISGLPEKYVLNYIAGLFDTDGCIKKMKQKESVTINISYTTISQNMAKQLNILFRTFGWISGIHRRKNDQKNCSIKILATSQLDFLNRLYSFLIVRKNDATEAINLLKNKFPVCQNLNLPLNNIIEKKRKDLKITKQFISQKIWKNNSSYWSYTRISKFHNRISYPSVKNINKINAILKSDIIKNITDGDCYFAKIQKIEDVNYNGFVYDISTVNENFIANTFYSHNCTYIRSDSPFIIPEVISEMRNYIPNNYGSDYLSSSINIYSAKSGSQEAHEAIRPIHIDLNSLNINDDNSKLYKIIWKRTIASQMADMVQSNSYAEIKCTNFLFSSSGSKITFDGWHKVWDYGNYDNYELPKLKIGEELELIDIKTEQKFTQPPSRYTESSLTKELEKRGIGRPSTYATIPQTLLDREYIEKQKNTISATELGIKVSDFLIESNFCFINLEFTADLEDKLDRIANGEITKLDTLNEFWHRLSEDLERAKNKKNENSLTNFKCKKCNGFLEIKHSRFGSFMSCQNRTNKEIKCDYKCDIGENGEPKEKEQIEIQYSDICCPNCQKPFIIRKSKRGNDYLSCRNWAKNKSCQGFYDTLGNKMEFKKKPFKKWGKKKNKD